jgi:hypothetical protein
MLQMRLSRRNVNFVMLTRTEDSLPVLTRHNAADHRHGLAYLAHFAVDPYFCSCILLACFRGNEMAE